jgi:amino acid adenylation domain-containing protein
MVSQIQGFRLSPQQSHLWKLQQESHAYHAQCAMLIEGDLKRAALEEALRSVVSRHEILRTTFHRRPGIKIPVQVIGESAQLDLHFLDLSNSSAEEQEARTEQQLQEQRSVPFDFTQGPVLRLTLLAISAGRHLLLMTLPALCADALSLKILVDEISRCYGCALLGEELSDEPVQYADLSEWQNELFESEDGEAGNSYWRGQDFSALPAYTLPFANASNSEAKFEPRFIAQTLHPELLLKIESLVGKYETSLSTFMLTCWQILLWRLNGRSDNIIGTSFDGRKYEELADAPGLFAKYLPLRCSLADALPFKQTLKQTVEQRSEIERWQEWFGWSQIKASVENTSPGQKQETLFSPLCFDFNEWSAKHSAGDVSFSIYKQSVCLERFVVKLSCDEKDGRLETQFHYDASLCRGEDIALLAAQFEALLESVVATPEAAIGKLSIFSKAERETLLVSFNRTAADFPAHLCLHQLFEEQAARSEDDPALTFKDSSISYGELDRRANQLARHLRTLGVGPDRIVGLYMERTPEMVVALLATLKAGGAYLPLDPVYPPERLAYMLEDARVSVLLTTLGMKERLDVQMAHVVCLDAVANTLTEESDAPLPCEVKPNNLAYVIYTSGSTGRPKGVMITHRGAVNYLSWATAAYQVVDGRGAPVHSSIGFDLTVTSLFTPLLSGRSVILIAEDAGLHGLRDVLRRQGNLSLLKITPAHLEMLGQSLKGEEAMGATRTLVIGGEALTGESLQFWKQFAPQTQIINEYGPTETVVGCCTYQFAAGETQNGAVPIGRPIANTQIYVLDGEGQPVSAGIVGEIFIGGEGVARGYLNHPELTAEKFIPDSISGEQGRRLYRSGDLGKFLKEGHVEYVGRADAQVKVRGYRIELGEIEAVIVAQQGVRDAVVIAREDAAGEKVLLAYVVQAEGAERGVEELKGELRKQLPEYMIPAALIRMDALPLTTNGKIDRKALPDYDADEVAATASEQAAQTPIEEIVAGVWAEVLGLKSVGINASFFELGGHSLLALRLVSRLQSAFQIELPVDAVFEAPTVSGLAVVIENIIRDNEGHAPRVISAVARDQTLSLSFAQQRLWIQDQLNPATASYNIPLAVRLDGKFDLDAFEQTIGEVIRRHEVLRTSFPRAGDLPVQAIAPAELMSVPVVNLCELPGAARESEALRLAVEEARLPFDLARGPLLRIRILRLDEERHYVLFTMHHIISDGWSMGVLVRELAVLYDAFSTGKPSPLPELPVQYADFAYWQRRWLQEGAEETQLAYWQQQLAGSQPVLRLRTDRPHPSIQTFQSATQSLSIARTLADEVRQLSRREGVTQFMTLLAAFQILLRRYTLEDDMLIGTDVANRNCREIEGLIGFFVNQLVLRTDLSGDPSFRDLLGRVRATALGAYRHQDLPFEKLVEVLKPNRSSNYSPLFQVKFIYQTAHEEVLEIPGGVLTPLDLHQPTTNLNLLMSVEDNGREFDTSLQFATDLFDAATINRMLVEFEALLGLITTKPEVKLSSLDAALDELGKQQQAARETQYREARRSLFRNIKQKAAHGSAQSKEPEQATTEIETDEHRAAIVG